MLENTKLVGMDLTLRPRLRIIPPEQNDTWGFEGMAGIFKKLWPFSNPVDSKSDQSETITNGNGSGGKVVQASTDVSGSDQGQ